MRSYKPKRVKEKLREPAHVVFFFHSRFCRSFLRRKKGAGRSGEILRTRYTYMHRETIVIIIIAVVVSTARRRPKKKMLITRRHKSWKFYVFSAAVRVIFLVEFTPKKERKCY